MATNIMLPKEVALEYLKRMSAAFRGEAPTQGELLDPNIKLSLPGRTPASATVLGLDALIAHAGKLGPYVAPCRDFNIFVEKVVANGERVAVLAKGRGEATNGRPYNNHYLMFFRIKNGKIVELFEDCDMAYVMWSIFGKDYVARS